MRISDWSSDVCSSDLFFVAAGDQVQAEAQAAERFLLALERRGFVGADVAEPNQCIEVARAEAAQRHPAQRVQVAQATGAILEVGFEVVGGVAEAFVPLALLFRLRSEEHTSELQSLMRI